MDDKQTIVVFDIGGVLVHVWQTWQQAAESVGVPTTLPEQLTGLEEVSAFVAYQAGQSDDEQYFAALGAELGVGPTEARRIHNGILAHEFPDSLQLVQDLKAKAIRTGVLSNTNGPHWIYLLSPEHYPSICATDMPSASHLLGLAKPDLRIFEAYEKLNGLAGSDIVFFDDNAANVAAAKAAGWDAHKIDPSGDPPAQMRAILTERGIL